MVSAPSADLSITLIDDVDPVNAGGTLNYTATVANAGPQDATNVVATMTLPAGVTFVSTTGCAEDPNGVPTCSLGTIAAGANVAYSVQVTVDVTTSGTITNNASVTSDVTDPNLADNAIAENTFIDLPLGTITIVKNTAPAAAGDGTFEFTSTDTDLDAISLTTVSNVATSAALPKVAGTYTISEDITAGWILSDITCAGDTSGGTVVNLGAREAVIDLDDGEAIVCTFTNIRDPNDVIKQNPGSHHGLHGEARRSDDRQPAGSGVATSRSRGAGCCAARILR